MAHTEQQEVQAVSAEELEKALDALEQEQDVPDSVKGAVAKAVQYIVGLLDKAKKALAGDEDDETEEADEAEAEEPDEDEEEDEDEAEEDDIEALLEELRRKRGEGDESEEAAEAEGSPAKKSLVDNLADSRPEIMAADEVVSALLTAFDKSLEARDREFARILGELSRELRDLRKSVVRMTKGLTATATAPQAAPAPVASPAYAQRFFGGPAAAPAANDLDAVLEKAVLAGKLSPAEAHGIRKRHGTPEWTEMDAARLAEAMKAAQEQQ